MIYWNDGDKWCRQNPVRTETELEEDLYDHIAELQLELGTMKVASNEQSFNWNWAR